MFHPNDHILDHADDFLHELLSEGDAAHVEQHCRQCRICEVALEEAQKRYRAVQAVPACEASEELISNTLAYVEKRQHQGRRLRHSLLFGVPSAVAAAVLLLAGFQFYYTNLEASPYDLRVLGQKELIAGARGSLRVQVLDLKAGTALAGVPVEIELRDSGPKKEVVRLAGFTTNNAGTGQPRFELPDWGSRDLELRVIARPHGNTELLTQTVHLKRSWKVMLSTDKPVYQPGQSIQVRALALRQQTLKPVAAESAVFSIADPKGNVIFKRQDATSKFGISSCACPLATELNEGAYTITCKVGDTESRRTVEVKKYVLPKFKIDVETDQPYYRLGQTVAGKVRVAYFFGKPVADGQVEIAVQATDVRLQTVRTLNLRTDGDGNAKFSFAVPDLTGREQLSGDAQISLKVTATDSAGQSQMRTVSRTVSRHRLRVEGTPESGQLVKGVPNKVFLFLSYPDGRPMKKARVSISEMRVYDGESIWSRNAAGRESRTWPSGDKPPAGEFPTDDLGVAVVEFTPHESALEWTTRVRDDEGANEEHKVILRGGGYQHDFILRTDKAVYDGGQTIRIQTLGGGSGTVYLDVVKDGQTVLTETLEMKDGRGEYHLDVPPDLFGTVELYAHRLSNDSGLPVRKSRVLFIRPAGEVAIQTTLDKPEYRPGAGAKLQFTLTDRQGKPAPGALSLAAVDEAVFSVLDAAPGMEQTFYLLEQELLKPIYAIYPWSPDLGPRVPADERDRFEQAIFARTGRATEIRDDPFFGPRTGIVVPESRKAARPRFDRMPGATIAAASPAKTGASGSPYSLSVASFAEKAARIAAERAAGLEWVYAGWATLIWIAVLVTVVAVLAGVLWTFAVHLQQSDGPSLMSVMSIGLVIVVLLVLVSITSLGTNASKTFNTVAMQVGTTGGAAPMAATPPTVFRALQPPPSEVQSRETADSRAEEPVRVRELFPETLLWKPELITDDQGRASLDLELADSITSWRLSASAVTADGRLGAAQTPIKVFQPFFVDLNLPVTLTRGDEVSIPVVVYNYLSKPQTVELKFETAPWFELHGQSMRQIDLAANEVRSFSYRLRVNKVGNHQLQVTARGHGVADALKRDIEVVPDGKKIEHVITDRLSADVTQTLTIPQHAVEDSAKLLVKIYPGTFSQVLEGTEGMLRMPFG